jgi:hypothetical protein
LVYFGGTQNADGSCTLTQQGDDGGVDSTVTLDCGGQTNQGSSWRPSTNVDGVPQIEFIDSGPVYVAGEASASALVLSCGPS